MRMYLMFCLLIQLATDVNFDNKLALSLFSPFLDKCSNWWLESTILFFLLLLHLVSGTFGSSKSVTFNFLYFFMIVHTVHKLSSYRNTCMCLDTSITKKNICTRVYVSSECIYVWMWGIMWKLVKQSNILSIRAKSNANRACTPHIYLRCQTDRWELNPMYVLWYNQ